LICVIELKYSYFTFLCWVNFSLMEILYLLHIVLGWYISNGELFGVELHDDAIIHALSQEHRVLIDWSVPNLLD